MILGSTLTSEFGVSRNGSFEMHAVNDSDHRSAHRYHVLGDDCAAFSGGRRHDAFVWNHRQAGAKSEAHSSRSGLSTTKLIEWFLASGCPEVIDDTDLSVGSASFSCDPAWGRCCGMVDVECVLTRRTRLQYMRCNGVGGSTC